MYTWKGDCQGFAQIVFVVFAFPVHELFVHCFCFCSLLPRGMVFAPDLSGPGASRGISGPLSTTPQRNNEPFWQLPFLQPRAKKWSATYTSQGPQRPHKECALSSISGPIQQGILVSGPRVAWKRSSSQSAFGIERRMLLSVGSCDLKSTPNAHRKADHPVSVRRPNLLESPRKVNEVVRDHFKAEGVCAHPLKSNRATWVVH